MNTKKFIERLQELDPEGTCEIIAEVDRYTYPACVSIFGRGDMDETDEHLNLEGLCEDKGKYVVLYVGN